jgi:EcoEI R protein C-terminal
MKRAFPSEKGVVHDALEVRSGVARGRFHAKLARVSIEPQDLELSPFNQRGGLGKVHQLLGEQLPKLRDELNEALAA